MINFKNRIPTQANRKKVTKSDGSVEFVTIEYADEPSNVGTPLDRNAFMAMQSIENFTTTIDFSTLQVSTMNDNGSVNTSISFNTDGSTSIQTVYTDLDGDIVTKTISMNGSTIQGVIS